MKPAELLPPVTRGRGYRLYDGRRRYLDMWQEYGHALLGHRPSSAQLVMKQHIDRGLLSAYPSRETERLESALRALLPGYASFRWYASDIRIEQLLREILAEDSDQTGIPAARLIETAVDPAVDDRRSDALMVWRPWLGSRSCGARIVLPVLPAPGTGWIRIAAVRDELPADYLASDPLPIYMLGFIRRSIYDLIAHLSTDPTNRWCEFDTGLWIRRGPYLQMKCSDGEYADLYREFLERGIMLTPDVTQPSIVPAQFDRGEIGPVQELSSRYGGG